MARRSLFDGAQIELGQLPLEVPEDAFAGYFKVWDGADWVKKPVKVWTGSEWVIKPLKFWNGSAWTLT
jgi:hypothetical protein